MGCESGIIASIEVPTGDDCNCVGIASITWNADYTVTITLTNGQSTTSASLRGVPGTAPTIAFRVAGTILQYNVDGGSWIDLFNFSTLAWASVLQNTYPDSATVGSGSVEIIGAKALVAGQLATDGDELNIYAAYTSTGTPSVNKYCLLGINATQLNGILGTFSMSNINRIEIRCRMSRLTATTGKIETEVTYINAVDEVATQKTTNGLSVTWANVNTIQAMARSITAGDIILRAFEITYGKK